MLVAVIETEIMIVKLKTNEPQTVTYQRIWHPIPNYRYLRLQALDVKNEARMGVSYLPVHRSLERTPSGHHAENQTQNNTISLPTIDCYWFINHIQL